MCISFSKSGRFIIIIIIIIIKVQQNYFDGPKLFSDPAKILDLSAKAFFL